MPTRTVTDKTLASTFVQEVIDEQAGNLTQLHIWPGDTDRRKKRRRRHVEAELMAFARLVAAMAMKAPVHRPDFSSRTWQNDWANGAVDAIKAAGYEQLEDQVIKTIMRRFPRRVTAEATWIKISLLKIASYTAQVARMIELGLPPEMLLMSPEQAQLHMMEMALSVHNNGGNVALVAV